jgi:hypothetical protein
MSKGVLLIAFAAASSSLDTLARLALTQRRRAPKKLPAVGAGECAPAPDALWLVGSFHQTSELSSSVKSTSIRLIFGRIDCSRRVLEARPKRLRRNGRVRSH